MKKTKIITMPGDIVKIPFTGQYHTYARILIEGSYAVYDCKTNIDVTDLSDIVQKRILFIVWVDAFALSEGSWVVVGNIPLEDKLKKFYPQFFNPAPTNSKDVAFYELHKDEVEKAIKNDWICADELQIGGLHTSKHVEQRILDYYEGRRNKNNEAMIKVFKTYAPIKA